MNIQKSAEIATILESRNIGDSELTKVIERGETTGEKFCHRETGRFLAHARIGQASYYVMYSVAESEYTVHAAYWHQSELS